jgi:hypothetical protein
MLSGHSKNHYLELFEIWKRFPGFFPEYNNAILGGLFLEV